MRELVRSTVIAMLAVVALLPAAPAAQTSSDLFSPDVVRRLELWVHSADWEKLKQNFQSNEYYPADVVWNDITVRNVGIRSRGLGSRSATKPGLRVDFDRYTSRQTFLGLKSFVLDNLVQDSSGIRETTAMRFFARMNLHAPREAHVKLYINGEYAGLYGLIESIDKDMLARSFGTIGDDTQNDGHLYEYNFINPWRFDYIGSGLEPYKTRFSPKTHESENDEQLYRRIEEVVRLANELPSSRYLSDLDPKLDLRYFIRYVAVQNFLGENDGFVGYDGMNNFYFYRKENSEQHVFISWDEDNAFWGPEFDLTTRHEENVLMRKAMEVRELSDLYYETLAEAARVASTPDGGDLGWLENEVRRQLDMIRDPMSDDRNRPYSFDDFESQRTFMIIFARDRSRFVESNLPR